MTPNSTERAQAESPMFCQCGRMKGDPGPYAPQCDECMKDLRLERPDWFNADGTPRPTSQQKET